MSGRSLPLLRRRGARVALSAAFLLFAACGGEERAAPPAGGDGTGAADAAVSDATASGTSGAAGAPRFRTAAQCGACHATIYEEWKESLHGRAMSDFLFLQLANASDNPEECIRCHAPVPIREVDFDTPIARSYLRDDAVSCLTCHDMGGAVAAPHEGMEGPCNPVYDKAQTDARRMCFGCHDQHNTGKEWLNGPYGPLASEPRRKPLTTCLDCHMPEVERPLVEGGPVRKGRRHTFFGGHSLEQLQKAATLDVEITPLEGGGHRFRVWVTNVGAGHNIPSDARHRSFDTYVKLWDPDGNPILDPVAEVAPGVVDIDQQERAKAATYRLFYRNSGRRDTQIPPLARISEIHDMSGAVDVPQATKGRGEAWLVYRMTPDDALVAASVTDPGTFTFYRARVVARVSFEFGE